MSIKSKDREIYYYSCIIVDELSYLEELLGEKYESILQNCRVRYLLTIRDKLARTILST